MSNLKKLNTSEEYNTFKASDLFVLPNVSFIVDGKIVMYNKKEKIPNNKILYTSNNNSIVTPYRNNFGGANIISNTYENGVGIITFDTDVTAIGSAAFQNCTSLTSVTIPNSVTSIRASAFIGCSSLTSINIPDGVTEINQSAFTCCLLTSISIPNSVTYIGIKVFYGCGRLVSVTLNSTTPPALGDSNVFSRTSSDLQIYVPDESVDAYKTAANWSSYADKIKPLSEKPA